MNSLILSLTMIFITIISYFIALKLSKIKYLEKIPVVIVSVIIVYCILIIFDIDVAKYQNSNSIIYFLLGPALVAFAIPLIKNFNVLKKNYAIILISVTLSTIFAVLSVILVAFLFKINSYIVISSIIPKSVTVPVAIEITKIIGGQQEITIILVMFSGLFGAIFGKSILKTVGVTNNMAVGSAMGFVSHILGTAICLEKNSLQAAVATITLILSCISTAIIAPIILYFIF